MFAGICDICGKFSRRLRTCKLCGRRCCEECITGLGVCKICMGKKFDKFKDGNLIKS